MFKVLLLVFIIMAGGIQAQAIKDTLKSQTINWSISEDIYLSNNNTAFWVKSNKFGEVLSNKIYGGLVNSVKYKYNFKKEKYLEFKVRNILYQKKDPDFRLSEIYGSYVNNYICINVGRNQKKYGIVDSVLTSGSYAWSGNSLPLPKIEIATNGYIPLSIFRKRISINATFAHGWFSNTDSIQNSYLHQKTVFVRYQSHNKKWEIISGINHFAQWGGRSDKVGNLAPKGKIAGSFRDYLKIISGVQPGIDTIRYSQFDIDNRLGNHVGSIDFMVSSSMNVYKVSAYYQHPFEEKSSLFFQNMPDGLYGVSLKFNKPQQNRLQTRRLLIEYLTTINQSGFDYDIGSLRYNGANDYFNNYQYLNGWTYKNKIIGSPLMTIWNDSKEELHNLKGGYSKMMISNNRVKVLYLAGEWKYNEVFIRARVSHSINYGRPIVIDERMPRNQLSGYIEISAPLLKSINQKNINARLMYGFDHGKWLENTQTFCVSISKVIL